MTLAEFAILVDASPKWILNARAILGKDVRYSIHAANRLVIARLLNASLGTPLPRAFQLAAEALRAFAGGVNPVSITGHRLDLVQAAIDVDRVVAAVSTRLSRVRVLQLPRQSGRIPSARRDAIRAATEYGLDVSLLAANLLRTPAQRLRQLDSMSDFRNRVRRSAVTRRRDV